MSRSRWLSRAGAEEKAFHPGFTRSPCGAGCQASCLFVRRRSFTHSPRACFVPDVDIMVILSPQIVLLCRMQGLQPQSCGQDSRPGRAATSVAVFDFDTRTMTHAFYTSEQLSKLLWNPGMAAYWCLALSHLKNWSLIRRLRQLDKITYWLQLHVSPAPLCDLSGAGCINMQLFCFLSAGW